MSKLKFLFFTFNISSGLYSQDKVSEATVVYIEPSDYVRIDFSKDSSDVWFVIYKKGFETKSKRDEATKQRTQKIGILPPVRIDLDFSYGFMSKGKPEILSDLSGQDYVMVSDFREKPDFSCPFFMIYRIGERYLKWKLTQEVKK